MASLYTSTGQAYEAPAGPSTDSLLALAWATAACAGRREFTSGDIFNLFDKSKGRDYDIGASPNLFGINAQRVVGVGDKGGRYELFDALTGKPTWRRQLCPGSHLGGLMTTAASRTGPTGRPATPPRRRTSSPSPPTAPV